MSNFLAWFTMTNDDQLSMLPAVEIDGEPAADVAAQWVADNEDTWTAVAVRRPASGRPGVVGTGVDAGHAPATTGG